MSTLKSNVMLAALAALLLSNANAEGFVDTLDLPAMKAAAGTQGPLLDVANLGDRLVVAGHRGHIFYSNDSGATWIQAEVPVSSDINALHFPTAQDGWAVGNDGVILHSANGGEVWTKQLDGRQFGKLIEEHYQRCDGIGADKSVCESLAGEGRAMTAAGADRPLLDVWFNDKNNGFAVGVFNLILRTNDGGQHWFPIMETTENPYGLHLTAINSDGESPYIVGEQGLVRKWDASSETFTSLNTPYEGSFFGVTGQAGELIVFGLRGNAFKSVDAGKSWLKLQSDVESSFTAAIAGNDGSYYLFTQAGHQFQLAGDQQLKHIPRPSQTPVASAVIAPNGSLIVVGSRGLQSRTVNK